MGEPAPPAAVGHLVDYLKQMRAHNPTFFYSIQESNDNNIFWVDPCFRMNYNYFGDTVRLHIAPPHYSLPLVTITGINHHAQPLLFGCGLLHSPSTESYVWLLQNFLHAMSGNYPVSITTQPDHHIQMAVQQVFPQTRHRFCIWAIFRQTIEKLPQTPQTFHNEFRKCIHDTETVHEFESCWQTLLHRYSLMDNEWLHSIYNARHQWVPAYMKQTFFGQLLLPQQEQEQEQEDEDMFFNGLVNSTTSIQSLVKQIESALTSWQEMELKADFETATTTPVLKTPSPMEKQAANLYTTRAFLKFQEELVETLAHQATKLDDDEEDSCVTTTYRVAKFGDDEQQEKKRKAHLVRFNSLEMKAICSCHMFEFSGIICRHALSVFRAQNVLTLPSQYILKRWTRDAKRAGEEYVPELLLTSSNNNSQDSLNVRYNNLRHEALKFVEEGAKSVHIYHTALDALQVAANKVDASKKRVNHHSVILNGGNQETALDKGSQQTSYQSKGEKEKKIRELTTELHNTNQQCEVYRANLLAVLRDMEEQKLKLSVKVQNARLSLKE